MVTVDERKSKEVEALIKKKGFDAYEISFACINLKNAEPKLIGYRMDHFMYPASVYKVFIGAETLRQVEGGSIVLSNDVEIKSPNDVDVQTELFPKDTTSFLKAGDKISIDELLSRMLKVSDNTAANVLIDIVGRENVTKNIILHYGWNGSEITRKFLNRKSEDEQYRFSKITQSCARHLAECFYLIETEKLVSPFVSNKLKEYMLGWKITKRGGLSIPEYKQYYRKGGWFEINLWEHDLLRALANIVQKGWVVMRWEHDAGVAEGSRSKYAVALLTVTKAWNTKKQFPIKEFARTLFDFMEKN